MENSRNNNTANSQQVSLVELFWHCLSKWYWFLVAVVVCLGLAVLYLMSTAPTYRCSASLIIKQDRRTGSSGIESMSTSFSNMGNLFAQQTNVYNEIIAFQSPDLMETVVNRLGLRAEYTVRQHLYDKTIYGKQIPVYVYFPDMPENQSVGLTINPAGQDKVELSEMYTFVEGERVQFDEPITVAFQDTVETTIGKVVAVPGLAFFEDNDFKPVKLKYSGHRSAVKSYAARLSVALANKESTAIDLGFSDHSAARAEDVLTGIINVYNEKWVGDHNAISVSTSRFIDERLVMIEKELGSVDDDISAFKSRNQLLDPQLSGSLYLNRATKIETEINEMNNRLAMARYIKDYLVKQENANQLIPANSGIENSGIESQISEYNNKQLTRNNLVANSSESSPLVIDLDNALRSMRGAIITSVDNYIRTLKNQISTTMATASKNTRQITESPIQVAKLSDIERQQKVKESLYLYLLQKREENELSQAFTAYNTRILTMPDASSSVPVSPKSMQILAMAILLGLAIPAGIIYFKMSTDTKLRGKSDLEGLITPFLGEIPLESHHNDKKNGIVAVKAKTRNMINEAFRVVRANLEFICGKEEQCPVLMITSFNVGSGKTYTSANMAAVLALKGQKVCVLDMDLRKATLTEVFHSSSYGIADYLSDNERTLEEVVLKDAISEGVDLIPVGTIPPNPSELLYSERLTKLIDHLKKIYDYILLDCPPVNMVADTNVLSRLVDRTIFIVRPGVLERSLLPEIDRFYNEGKLKGLMLLLNGTKGGSRSKYGFGYGYYGYGYGYGEGQRKTHGYR